MEAKRRRQASGRRWKEWSCRTFKQDERGSEKALSSGPWRRRWSVLPQFGEDRIVLEASISSNAGMSTKKSEDFQKDVVSMWPSPLLVLVQLL
ncbi:UNVERIFIED_CONTAM: hypothetical protein Sradi_3664800 [Sesamum radiatum]|uniref:Uncharacterized protein n=1 Tax=Sesamum radiatum TaxID=300843 RepID=A0AAW2QIT1_SESRA